MFDWVQARATQGHSQSSRKATSALSWLCALSCWKVNLWPSLRSWALWTRFSLRIFLHFGLFNFSSTLTNPPVSATEKHPYNMMLPPPCFTVGMFPPDMTLRILAKQFNLSFIRPDNLVSHQSESPLFDFLQTTRSVESARMTIGFLVTSLTKALLPQLLSLASRLALGRVLVVPNFFHLRIMQATVLLWTFNGAEMFFSLPQFCASTQSCLWALQAHEVEGMYCVEAQI